MRRIGLTVFVALALVALAAPAATAKTVIYERNSEVVVEAGWYSGEWGDPVIVSGYAGARHRKGGAVGEMYFYQGTGTAVTCDAGTPEDPSDDFLGYEWVNIDGWGPATVTVSKTYASGNAVATVDGWSYQSSDCDWYYPENGGGDGAMVTVEVAIDLTGDGPLVRSKGSNSFHIPGEYKEHSKNSSTYRNAVGTVTVDATPYEMSGGQIGQYSWSMHVTSK